VEIFWVEIKAPVRDSTRDRSFYVEHMSNVSKKNYILKLYKDNGKVEIVRTHKRRRFFRIIRTINWQNGIKKALIKVSYGKKACNFGCLCDFYNAGSCSSRKKLLEMLRYFDEET